MKKNILIIFLQILFITGVYATAQKTIILNGNETKYIDPYFLMNNTPNKIMAPYTNSVGKIGGNKFNISTNSFISGISFGNNLLSSIDYGSFIIGNASYNINYGSWSSCSENCGGGIKSRYISCKREDGSLLDKSFCGLFSNRETNTCNTQACLIPVNGICGITNNTCTEGVLSDITDTSTQYLWNCNGSNGGSNTSCSVNKPVNNFELCEQGLSMKSYCGGDCGGGGDDGYCQAGCDMISKYCPINGTCGTTNNSCISGILSDKTDSSTQYKWNCNGSNGGSNASCSKDKLIAGYCEGQVYAMCGVLVSDWVKNSYLNKTDCDLHDNTEIGGNHYLLECGGMVGAYFQRTRWVVKYY